VLPKERARGLRAPPNAGLAVARGEWAAFLDDDDVWSPHKLRLQIDSARATGADWVYGIAIVVGRDLQPIDTDPFPDPAELPDLLLRGNFVPGGGSNVIARAETVQRVGAFDESLRFFEDWDLWLRLVAVGLPAACPEPVLARVEHGANMIVRDAEQVMSSYERVMSKHRPVADADRLAVSEWLAFEQHKAGHGTRAAVFYARAAAAYRSPGNLAPALGALFGETGMRLASRVLKGVGGASHFDVDEPTVPVEPAWLASFR
jgi:glycosyltransferase involved in cell wall biosynthesis